MSPPQLPTKLQFYREPFLRLLENRFIVSPGYTHRHMSHAMQIVIRRLRVSSHRIRIESGRAMGTHGFVIYRTREVETEEHYMFRCPPYYAIHGRFHLFLDGFGSLSWVIQYKDQRCLGLYMELCHHRDAVLRQH